MQYDNLNYLPASKLTFVVRCMIKCPQKVLTQNKNLILFSKMLRSYEWYLQTILIEIMCDERFIKFSINIHVITFADKRAPNCFSCIEMQMYNMYQKYMYV